jgi:hypothetical protein
MTRKEMKPISRTEFSAATANLRAEFDGIDGGIPASMNIIQNGERITLPRENERDTLEHAGVYLISHAAN